MKFRFSVDPDGEIDGNDASQEHFAGNRLSSVARELGQNTNDARSEEAKEKNLPAVISFKNISIPTSDIPDIKGLIKKLEGCESFAKNTLKNSDLSEFYTDSIKIISKSKLNVLEVTDWNTTGLEGPYEAKHSRPIIAFAKGKGISEKGTNNAGGSRGIGKNAIFTISSLRTIFFATYSLDRQSKKLTHYTQGKSVFISDFDEDGNLRKGKGYCGQQGAVALEGTSELPDWLDRTRLIPSKDKRGLSLFALGFEQGNNWNKELGIAALTTFFSAISQGFIEFLIEDSEQKIVLNKNNYLELFDDENITNYLPKDQVVSFNKAKIYAEILDESVKENSAVHVREFESAVGRFKLCIKVEDGLPNKVAFIRTGMMITDKVNGLIRFSGKDFAATLEATSDTSIEFIRSLEGAEHNALQPDRIDDPKKRKLAHNKLISISKRARTLIDSYIKIETDGSIEINELTEFFPYQNDQTEDDKEKGELNPLGKIILAVKKPPKPIPTKLISNDTKGSKGEIGNTEYPHGEGNARSGVNESTSNNGSGGQDQNQDQNNNYLKTTDISNLRAPYKRITPDIRTISFTPLSDGILHLNINIAGGDEDVILNTIVTSKGEISGNMIKLKDLKSGQRVLFNVQFDRDFKGAISINALKPQDERNLK